MTHNACIKKLLKYNTIFKRHYLFLRHFNPRESFTWNAKKLSSNYIAIHNIIAKYHVKTQTPIEGLKRTRNRKKAALTKKRIKMWSPKLTIQENAKRLKIAYDSAAKFRSYYGLPYVRSHNYKDSYKKIRVKELLGKGLKYAEIARIVGLSRERVRQIAEGI